MLKCTGAAFPNYRGKAGTPSPLICVSQLSGASSEFLKSYRDGITELQKFGLEGNTELIQPLPWLGTSHKETWRIAQKNRKLRKMFV